MFSMSPPSSGAAPDSFARIVGSSARLTETVQKAQLLAKVNTTVLLGGETGTGKEVFARAIHEGGPQAGAPFVALNCGGLPRDLLAGELFGHVDGAFTGARRGGACGKLQAADGGTLLLDEIGEMPLELQPVLLRVLEGGELYRLGSTKPFSVTFRLISASNRDLRAEVAAGRFRQDLYYRISVTSLQIPALRERYDDLPALVAHFSADVSARHRIPLKSFAPDVLTAFAHYGWPGNIRELRNVIESLVLLTESHVVTLAALPSELQDGEPAVEPLYEPHAIAAPQESWPDLSANSDLRQLERRAIGETLRTSGGNLTRAAQVLRIARSTLYQKVKRHALEADLNQARLGGKVPAPDATSSDEEVDHDDTTAPDDGATTVRR